MYVCHWGSMAKQKIEVPLNGVQFPVCIKMVHHSKDIQPAWHNCGKHWSQHGPTSLWNAWHNVVHATMNWGCSEGKHLGSIYFILQYVSILSIYRGHRFTHSSDCIKCWQVHLEMIHNMFIKGVSFPSLPIPFMIDLRLFLCRLSAEFRLEH